MESAHSLLLNEDTVAHLPDNKKAVFIFEWLRFLDKVLGALQRADIKDSQERLTHQLTNQLTQSPGPPTRCLLAKCLATLFSIGETTLLFDTIDKCNEIIKNRDDSPSSLPNKLAAITCIGVLYEKLGRMVGRSFEETVGLLMRNLRSAESLGRYEIMNTLERIVLGLGSAGTSIHKEVYKAALKLLGDRAMSVRCAASKCVLSLVREAPFLLQTEVDHIVNACCKSLDGSNYDVRCHIAQLLGSLLADCLNGASGKTRRYDNSEVFLFLSNAFTKAGRGSAAVEIVRGASAVNREIRVGITHAYVEFVKRMGPQWLEKNLSMFIDQIVSLASNPRTTPTHIDSVYACKCIVFILSSVIQGMLGEKAQVTAAKELARVIKREMDVMSAETHCDSPQQAVITQTQHTLVCCLQELGGIVRNLGTTANQLIGDSTTDIVGPVMSALTHVSSAARLAAAWCLRSIAIAVPALLTPLLEKCMERMDLSKSSSDGLTGHSFAIAALLGAVSKCPLGIPFSIGKKVFNLAEDLLRSAAQSSRLSLPRIQSGWLIISALMTMGASVVRGCLPTLLLLWRNAFPRSVKELETEKSKGDAFTWQVALDGRAGALAAMHSFIVSCPDLLTSDTIKRILVPLECAFILLQQMPAIIKMHGAHLKACGAMLRLRLYDILYRLPPTSYEGAYKALFRELVAEFTLTENPANTSTSLLRNMCHIDDSVILGSWLQETDHKEIEDQLQPNSAAGSGALEHDPVYLYSNSNSMDPGPLPLGVAVIDSSVRLYGMLFPRVSDKHKQQMLAHFRDCIKQAKNIRQQAIQVNIFTAVLCALKFSADCKKQIGSADVRAAALAFIMDALASPSPLLRCASGEALGRLMQCCDDGKLTADMVQKSFEKLQSSRDVVSRTGHSLALGCLHRYVGGMTSGQHLSTSVSILVALATDFSAPVVQVWALHALGLIADSGGPMFRTYVDTTLSLVLNSLLTVPPSHTDVHQCLGKCLAALITNLGPELQGTSAQITDARLSCLVSCAIMQDHPDSLVQAQAISCLQQLHLFAPRHVNLSSLVPQLCLSLTSTHLLLRRAAVACLRQLAQREAIEISDYARTLYKPSQDDGPVIISEAGLEGALFALLDREIDSQLRKDVRDTLVSMLQSLVGAHLTHWFELVRNVLSAATDLAAGETGERDFGNDTGNSEDKEAEDDDAKFSGVQEKESKSHLAPKWPTRVFAVSCMIKIMQVCKEDPAHLELSLARELKEKKANSQDYLVLHLSELVRVAFIAATSDSDKLRLGGLELLQDIIRTYGSVAEPEFPDHVVLEQYQAQVSAALRPAFAPDTPSDVTAAACEVCSTWIRSGVARDLNDLRRVHQLLASSLDKLRSDGRANSGAVYSETAGAMEKLAVLRAWAEVYIEAVSHERKRTTTNSESLLELVNPELRSLARLWLAILRDYALLSLPPDFQDRLPPEGGMFFTMESRDSTRIHYRNVWASCIYAMTLYLKQEGFDVKLSIGSPANAAAAEMPSSDRFHLLLGISMEALCSRTSSQSDDTIIMCLKAIETLLTADRHNEVSPAVAREILAVLHRLLLTRDNSQTRYLTISVLEQLVATTKKNTDCEDDVSTGSSFVFACLEVCLAIMVRHIPAINTALISSGFFIGRQKAGTDESMNHLLSACLQVLGQLPPLCSPKGKAAILPIVLYLVTGTVRELSSLDKSSKVMSPAISTALQVLVSLCTPSMMNGTDLHTENDIRLLQSTILFVLDLHSTSRMQNQIMLAALTVLSQSCPAEAVAAPHVKDRIESVLQSVWAQDKDPQVQTAFMLACQSLFKNSDVVVSHTYIQAFGPLLFEFLSSAVDDADGLNHAALSQCIGVVESLVLLASQDKRVGLIALLLSILGSYLLPSPAYGRSSKAKMALHELGLQHITALGGRHSAEFKIVVSSSPALKSAIEAAVKLNQTNMAANQQKLANLSKQKQQSAPTIKLKMDFGNFT